MTTFDPGAFDRFEHTSFAVAPATGVVTCRYRLSGPDTELRFEEVFTLGGPAPDGPRAEAVTRVARLLWLAAGVSYYKAAAPPVVTIPADLSAAERDWFEALYREGLGEFAVGHGIDLSARPRFVVGGPDHRVNEPAPPLKGLGLPRRSLVPVGGGKDSCVAIDILHDAGEDIVLFNVGGHRAARDVAVASGLPLTTASRRLDPRLGELNARGALNGHVPVTAIVSLVAVLQALVTGADHVVFANERSADAANFVRNGLPVNHQYSKGLTAERRLRAALAEVSGELECYSLLRPLSELHIAQFFARSERYFPVFTSCNAAFRIDRDRRVERWCGSCPKCRFVFLALAPFLDRRTLTSIFGADLLADLAQLPGYRELAGLAGHKPFECVGEIEESRVAVRMLADSAWADAPVVAALVRELEEAGLTATDALLADVFTPSPDHALPAAAERALSQGLATVAAGGAR